MIDLSIVIPTFNTAAMTLRCCDAVLASMPPQSEVIVVDDGSRDGTAELLRHDAPRVQIVRLETNRGFAAAANAGVAATSGRIVLLLNSDAIVEPDALGALLAAFDADARLGVAGARLLNDDGSPQWSGGRAPTLPWMIGVVSGAGHLAGLVRRSSGDAPRAVDWVSGAAMAFRCEVWSVAGPLSERFAFYCQDIEFCLRARAAGWAVRVIEEARVRHGLGQTIAAQHPLRHDPERLWPDLLAWGAAHYGRMWTIAARVVLASVAAARALVRLPRRDGTSFAMLNAAKRLLKM